MFTICREGIFEAGLVACFFVVVDFVDEAIGDFLVVLVVGSEFFVDLVVFVDFFVVFFFGCSSS